MASKTVRWTGRFLGGLAVLILLAVLAAYLISEHILGERVAPQPSSLAVPTAAQLADGARQLDLRSCTSCHQAGLRGGLFLDEPNVAKLYAPNISLLAPKMSDAQLDQAIRQGIGHDGKSLFIMPSQQYQFMTDEETAALIKAIRALPPGGTEQPQGSLGPIGRIGLVLGKFKTAPTLVAAYRDKRLADLGPAHAVGRHLVETSCTECHGALLEGHEVKPGSVAPDLSVVAGYDLPQFEKLLREGVAPSGKPLGLMAEVSKGAFRHFTDAEIKAVHDYLVARAPK